MTTNTTTNTTTGKQRKPRPRPARSARLLIRPDGTAPAAVEITVGMKAGAYLVTELPADFGRGFLVEKIEDGTPYHVNLDGDKRTCECRGFLYHGHCKHVDSLAALLAADRL